MLPLCIHFSDTNKNFINKKDYIGCFDKIIMKIIEKFEKDDEKIAKVRELNKNGVYDVRMEEKINLENKMIMHKKKWMSTVPTAMEYFNSGIKNEDNKFIL